MRGSRLKFHICWTIDCESSRREINDLSLGEHAIRGFAEILEEKGWRGTFFLTPEEVQPFASLLAEKAQQGHEIGIHLHPDESGFGSAYLGTYSRAAQKEIYHKARATFENHLGIRPTSCRPGYCSANDSTFPVMAECG